jgi:predicted 2-oxoglutarate/Fe(II)-dependent dioxygenase YbiX
MQEIDAAPKKELLVIEKYFTNEDVLIMLRYPTKIQKPSQLPNMAGAFGFETSAEADQMSMNIPIAKLTNNPEDNESILKITDSVLKVKEEMEKFFGLGLSMTNCNYAVLYPGGFNPMHSDSSQLDGTPYHENEETEYSALIYLNESGVDYEGGDIIFPLQQKRISPKAGMVVFFRGDHHHPHEVEVVTKGERKALVLFFARKGNVSDRPLFSDEHSGVPTPAVS